MNRAITKDYIELHNIPEEFITEDLCLYALNLDYNEYIDYVPKACMTEKICKIIMEHESPADAFHKVYDRCKIPEDIIKSALVDKFYSTIAYITPDMLTPSIQDYILSQERLFPVIDYAIGRNKNIINLYDVLGDKIFESNKLDIMMRNNPDCIRHVPNYKLTTEMALSAIYRGVSISKINFPEYMSDDPTIINAILYRFETGDWDISGIKLIAKHISAEQWLRLYDKDPMVIRCLPKEYMTYEFCKNHANQWGLTDIPKEMMLNHQDIWQDAIKRDLGYCQFVPESVQSTDEYKTLVKNIIEESLAELKSQKDEA